VTGQKGRLKATGKTHEKVEVRSYLGRKFLDVWQHVVACGTREGLRQHTSFEFSFIDEQLLSKYP
jgi:hypothetical protein